MESRTIPSKNLIKAKQHFNCSIFEKQNSYFLAYRANKGFRNCQLAIVSLDNNFNPEPDTNILLSFPEVYKNKHMFEDPRIFKFRNQYWIAFSNICTENHCQSQGIAKLSNFFEVQDVHYINFGDNINGSNTPKQKRENNVVTLYHAFEPKFEKNWVFFEHEHQLHFIYNSVKNHTVCKLDDNLTVVDVVNTHNDIIWPYGEIRGGCPPRSFDSDHFVHFFHSSFNPPEETWGFDDKPGRVYVCGAYLFEKQYPHTITHITQMPLFAGDFYERRDLYMHAAVFPCGSIKTENEWIISYGCNDCKCKLFKITHEELKQKLICLTPRRTNKKCTTLLKNF